MSNPRCTVPPSPKDHWLLGNLRLSRDDFSKTFARWGHEFGPVFEFCLLPPKMGLFIVVNHPGLAKELMNREDFAGRGNVVSPFGLIKYPLGQGIIWPQRSDEWMEFHRFLSTAYFDQRRLESAVVAEMDAVVEAMTETGGAFDPQHLFEQAVVNSIARMVFGETSDVREKSPFRDHVISLPRDIFQISITPLYAFFPSLIHYYETALVKKAIGSYDFIVDFIETNLKQREKKLKETEEAECLIDAVVIERRKRPDAPFLSEKNIQHAVLDFLFSGDTLSATLSWTVAWLLHYPDVGKKVLYEIQRVVGNDVSPSPESLNNVDYLQAFVEEVLRRSSAADFSVPHGVLKQSASLGGFTITDDKFVIINLWACNHDPKLWDNPMEFSPERFLDSDGKYKRNENMLGFGVGLRRCMGERQARMILQVFVARFLLKADFALAEGTEMPAMNGRKLLIRLPEPYQIIVKAK